ncbi:MAG: DTW domain-containing protein [Gammaproteobacteria bacterium]|nr:DTW domain-containing protein [Gammaproteobacteria bacterium]MDP2140615.1 DTW domain-containing protein [Gammaproteobacteria bacterium]MDP2347387.1 DTW domain-containing protein [Gammaproteobacteria bacterium]
MSLRIRELAKTRKPFMARGSKVKRCATCLLPLTGCICAARPQPSEGSAFCFLMYYGEAFKPTNTGRLIADVVRDNHAFVWDRTRLDPALLSLLADPRYAPIVVFPKQYAEEERCISSPAEVPGIQAGRTPLYIMLDGTWREAKKMFRSEYLRALPVLGVDPENASNYQLREAVHKHQLCTAEVAAMVLALGGDHVAAQALTHYFAVFRRNYIAGKPHMVFKEEESATE